MKIFNTVNSLRRWRRQLGPTLRVGFVPTMGALHDGHLSLIRRAKRENDRVVVSIFVNPTQFGPKEDFAQYPRPWKRDRRLLSAEKVDVLFNPSVRDMYPDHHQTQVAVSHLSTVLCGDPRFRGPGHFYGVATVVTMLFNMVEPDRAYFGQKDFQQIQVIKQMVRDLHCPVAIVECPTIREPGGLAMSSRNAYLKRSEHHYASKIYAALQYGRKLLTSHRKLAVATVRRQVWQKISSIPNAKIDYVELVDPATLERVKNHYRPVLMAVAVRLGRTRLIDNIRVKK